VLVGVAGFEPATPSSRTRCATRLRYTPTFEQDCPYTHATPPLQDHLVGSMNWRNGVAIAASHELDRKTKANLGGSVRLNESGRGSSRRGIGTRGMRFKNRSGP
jgi:hypothetical protein